MEYSAALVSYDALNTITMENQEERGHGVHWVTLPHEEIPIRVRKISS